MAWRLAIALEILRSQVNAKWQHRSKNSDGSVGDVSHSSRTSDHNPDDNGIVRAIDLTHDPVGGFDSYAFADMILKKQDRRLKYVISNRRIGSGPDGPQPGSWREYRVPPNKNPHDHHCHISVVADAKGDDPAPWDIGAYQAGAAAPYVAPPLTLRRGSIGEDVKKLQAALHIFIDGRFGILTEDAVKFFQKSHHMVSDGIVGPQTWKEIGESK